MKVVRAAIEAFQQAVHLWRLKRRLKRAHRIMLQCNQAMQDHRIPRYRRRQALRDVFAGRADVIDLFK